MAIVKRLEKKEINNFSNPPRELPEFFLTYKNEFMAEIGSSRQLLMKILKKWPKIEIVSEIVSKLKKDLLLHDESISDESGSLFLGLLEEGVNYLAFADFQQYFSPNPVVNFSSSLKVIVDFEVTKSHFCCSPDPRNFYIKVKDLRNYKPYFLVLHDCQEQEGKLIYTDLSFVGGFREQHEMENWIGVKDSSGLEREVIITEFQTRCIELSLIPKECDWKEGRKLLDYYGCKVKSFDRQFYQVQFPQGWQLVFDFNDSRKLKLLMGKVPVAIIFLDQKFGSSWRPLPRFIFEAIEDNNFYQLRAFDQLTGNLFSFPRLISYEEVEIKLSYFDRLFSDNLQQEKVNELLDNRLYERIDNWLKQKFKSDFYRFDWSKQF